MAPKEAKKYKKWVEEIIEDECYDMMDEFSVAVIQKYVMAVLPMVFSIKVQRIGESYEYITKIKNSKNGSYISISNDDCTGLSESCWYIFEKPFAPTKDELKIFLDMLNEAWYLLNNGD